MLLTGVGTYYAIDWRVGVRNEVRNKLSDSVKDRRIQKEQDLDAERAIRGWNRSNYAVQRYEDVVHLELSKDRVKWISTGKFITMENIYCPYMRIQSSDTDYILVYRERGAVMYIEVFVSDIEKVQWKL